MPGFFGEQALRLIRERWGSAQELAEELYSMATKRGPTTTDRPLILYRNSDDPAIKIIDNTDGSSPPIQIVGGNPDTASVDPGNFDCCKPKGSSGGGGGGGGSGPPHDDGSDDDGSGESGNNLGGAGPSGSVPRFEFSGSLEIELTTSGDPYGWNGQHPFFTGTECRLYNPPTIPAPGTAMAFPTILNQLNAFLALPTLAPYLVGYVVTNDTVTGPGSPCTGG